MNQLQRGALSCSTLEALELNLHLATIRSEGSSDLPLEPWLEKTFSLCQPWRLPSPLWILWAPQWACLLDRALAIGGHSAIHPGNELNSQILRVCCLVFWGGKPRGEVSTRPFLLDGVALQPWPFEHIPSLWFQSWIWRSQHDTLRRLGVSS